MNPGSDLVIYAQQYIGEHGHLTYNGGHLLLNVTTIGNPQDLGLEEAGHRREREQTSGVAPARMTRVIRKSTQMCSKGLDRFLCSQRDRTHAYLELTDVDPYQQESDTYDLWVAGTQVTKTNQNDVLEQRRLREV